MLLHVGNAASFKQDLSRMFRCNLCPSRLIHKRPGVWILTFKNRASYI